MIFKQLDQREQKLLSLIQSIGYGRLEKLTVQNGYAVFTADSRKICSRKIGAEKFQHNMTRADGDFILNDKYVELLSIVRATADGIINVIQIQAGLPVSLEIEEKIA